MCAYTPGANPSFLRRPRFSTGIKVPILSRGRPQARWEASRPEQVWKFKGYTPLSPDNLGPLS